MIEAADAPRARRRAWSKPGRLYEEIARDLTDAIIQGYHAPGVFLPTEHALGEEYGASRNVIRESLKLLMARGLIEMLHGRGSRVLPPARWQLPDQLVHVLRHDQQLPRNLLELRRILEIEIAGLSAERATAEQISAMRTANERMRDTSESVDECIAYDLQFHQLLVEATANTLLLMVLEPVGPLLRASRLATIHLPGAISTAFLAHAGIVDRIEERDSVGARQAMRDHLLQNEDEIRQAQGEPDAQSPRNAPGDPHSTR